MSIPITLSNGQTIIIEESTGNVIGDPGPLNTTRAVPPGGLAGPYAPPGTYPQDQTGVGGAPGGSQPPFDPKTHRVVDTVRVGNGTQVTYSDGTNQWTTFLPNEESGAGSYAQSQQTLRNNADLAEQARQFNETFGFNKARFNTQFPEEQRQFNEQLGFQRSKFASEFPEQQRQFDATLAQRGSQFNADLDFQRGKTLLGLGSRPDTLQRYLYALQGKQSPQALGGVAPVLPGGFGVPAVPGGPTAPQGATPAPFPAPRPGPGPFPPGPAPAPNPAPNLSTGYASPYEGLSGFNRNGTLRLAASDPDAAGLMAKYPGQYTIGSPTSTSAPSITATAPTTLRAEDQALIAAGRTPKFYSDGVAIFKHGGPIPEHVIGVGMKSGKTYEFGEAGPEYVVSNDKMADLMGVLRKSGKEEGGVRQYQEGGMVGYDPTSLFNPTNLAGIVQQGYNTDPSVPLSPEVGFATGGGQSLVPSAQRLNSLLPSQQQSYAGFLQDEAGVLPEDVFSIAGKLMPKVRNLQTPRYVQ